MCNNLLPNPVSPNASSREPCRVTCLSALAAHFSAVSYTKGSGCRASDA